MTGTSKLHQQTVFRHLKSGFLATLLLSCVAPSWLNGARSSAEPQAPKSEVPAYGRIESVIQSQCLACHSSGSKMGGLVLETYDGLLKGGQHGPVIVPGKGSESRLIQMLEGEVKPQMPFGGDPLPAATIALFKAWIDAGAKGPAAGEAAPAHLTATPIPNIKPRAAVASPVAAVAFSPDGKLLAVGGYKEVRLIDPSNGEVRLVLTGHSDLVRAVVFTPDGTRLAAAGGQAAQGGEIKIWETATGKLLHTIEGHKDCIYSIAISPDGKLLASTSYDKLVKLWNIDDGRETRTLKDHIDAVFSVAFSPDGKRLASGAADRTVKIWDVASGQRLYTLSEPQDGVMAVAFHPSGKQLAAAGMDKIIRTWELTEKGGTLAQSTYAHEDAILRLVYSPDGKRLISSSADQTIRIWDAATLTSIKVFEKQPDWVEALSISPDGKMLAAGRYDGSLSVYDLETDRVMTGPLTAFGAAPQSRTPREAASR